MTFPALGSIRRNSEPRLFEKAVFLPLHFPSRKGFHSFQAGAPLGFSWTLSPRRINTKTKHQEEEEEEEERRIGLFCRRHETCSTSVGGMERAAAFLRSRARLVTKRPSVGIMRVSIII